MSSDRRYRGRTPGEALHKARVELGGDARLVSARRVSPRGLPPVYEVLVTVASAPERTDDATFRALRHEIRELQASVSSWIATARPVPSSAEPSGGSSRGEESTAESHGGGASSWDPELEPWRDLLRRRGASADAIEAILRTAGRHLENRLHDNPRAAVRAALADRFGPVRHRDRIGDRSTLFVGPSGAGKTTTAAKVAAELVAAGERPILVCADGESLTGEESLQAVATALSLPFEVAFLDGRLEKLVARQGEDRTYLVDTAGTAPGDPRAIDRLRPLVEALDDPAVLLVLSATSDVEEIRLAARSFEPLGVERVVLTRLDETARPGRLVDLAAALPCPLARVTYGRSARGSSAPPGADEVVDRILGSHWTVETTA